MAVKGAGIWLLDRDMRVVWMNDVMEEAYGNLDDVRGKNCYRVFRGRDSKCPECLPMQTFETGNIVTGYTSRKMKNGVDRYFQLVDAPLMDSKNNVVNVLEIVLDVTERARVEWTIRESEKEYRALFENAGMAVAVCDRNGILARVNHAFEELAGVPKAEIEGKIHYLMFVHPRDRARIEQMTEERRVRPHSVPTTYEFMFVGRHREERLIHINVNPMPDGAQVVSMIDTTEKWRLEQEIRNKEQFLANILRHSMEAITAMDGKGYLRSWNRGAELMFGYKAKEILGRPFRTILAPEFRRSKKISAVTKQFHEQGFLKNYVAEAITKDGKRILIDITRTVIRDAEGKEIGSSAIIRDVTESRRQAQRTIQKEKMLAMGELAASLAHEIKNPLNSMVINMEVLKGHFTDLPAPKREALCKYVDVLSSETSRLDNVMKRFLDFARPIEGQFEKLNLGKVVSQVAELLRAQLEKERIKLRLHVEPDLPPIEGIEDHLKQIFLNLMLNAVQAMPDGGRLSVEVSPGSENTVQVVVSDTGVGIPRQNFAKVFDLHFSTKEKGSGLGLSLVKRLVTAQSGKIEFQSKVNHGTKFTVTFSAA
ncbi:MAG: PAS domain S-box protein [Pseudomonadota bacterium]